MGENLLPGLEEHFESGVVLCDLILVVFVLTRVLAATDRLDRLNALELIWFALGRKVASFTANKTVSP
jgi:hypothetical protein